MPALSFKSQFAGLVQTGRKTQTIRAPRKRPFKVGDTLHLFTAMRTPQCRKIGEAEAIEVSKVAIRLRSGEAIILVGSRVLSPDEAEELSVADGFGSFAELEAWFAEQHGLPFSGTLIRWRLKMAGGVA